MRICVTGARGLIGDIVMRDLRAEHQLRPLDRRGWPPMDLRIPRLAALAMRGQEVVVDLAANVTLDDWPRAIRNNITLTRAVFEGARRAGVKRVVYASSNHVTGLYEHDEPYRSVLQGDYGGLDADDLVRITTATPVRPDGAYAVSKIAGEAVARFYSDHYGISAICLRIGTVNRLDRPSTDREFATWLSHRDLATLVRAAIQADDSVRFGTVYGVSANRWRIWDTEGAGPLLGWHPQDNAESFR